MEGDKTREIIDLLNSQPKLLAMSHKFLMPMRWLIATQR